MDSDAVDLRVFGPPALTDAAGRSRALRTRKQLGLLVYLALSGRERPVAREHLSDLLWGGAAPDRARHSLAQALTEVRGKLGDRLLSRGSGGVRLVGAVRTELDRMRAGEIAPDLGAPLAGAEFWAGAAWAHWVEGARIRLRDEAAGVLRTQLEECRARGAMPEVFACGRVLYRLDPVSDVAVMALGEARLVCGDVVGAIRLLQDHVERVEAELGCNPHPHVATLLRRLQVGAYPPVETVPARLAAEAKDIRQPVFVGRTDVLATLEAEWGQVLSGVQRACMVRGPAGIGKSSLVRRFAASLAARAFPAVVVSCQEMGHGIPFAAAADLIATLARDPATGGTDPLWLAEASRVSPVLKTSYPGIPEPGAAPPESIRIRLAEALFHILEAVTDGQGIALLFDDVQHMDPATRDVLFVLQRRLAGARVFLLGTRTTQGIAYPSLSFDAVGQDLRWDMQLTLPPLSVPEADELIVTLAGGRVPDRTVRDQIVRLSEGNPYFVEMLVSDWERHAAASLVASDLRRGEPPLDWRPPDTLRLAFARLYAGLDTAAQQMLHVLAVARRGMGISEILSITGLSTAVLDRSILSTIQRGIIRVDKGAVTFKSQLHQAFAYYAQPDEHRKYLHARMASGIAASLTPGDVQQSLEVAHHYHRAGLPAKAQNAVLSVASEAIRSGSASGLESAIRLVLPGSASHSSYKLQVCLLEALAAQGKYADVLPVAARLISMPEGPSKRKRHTLALILRAEALQRSRLGDDAEILSAIEAALSVARDASDDELLAQALQIQAEVLAELGDFSALEHTEMEAAALAAESRSLESKGRALLTSGFCKLTRGNFPLASATFSSCIPTLRQIPLHHELARGLNGLGISMLGDGRHPEAIDTFAEAVQLATASGDHHQLGALWSNIGVGCEELGRFELAAQCYEEALSWDKILGSPRRLAIAFTNAADMAIITGKTQLAAGWLEQASQAATKSGLWQLIVGASLAEADLALAKGEKEIAWRIVEECLQTVGDRASLMRPAARFNRLKLHYLLATIGSEAAQREAEVLLSSGQLARVTDRLEIQAFTLSFRGHPADRRAESMARPESEIVRRGYLGILGRLVAANTPVLAGERRPGESGSELIERLFQEELSAVPLPSKLLDLKNE